MRLFVISLPNATDRHQHIAAEFSKKGLDFTLFDALNPAQGLNFFNTFMPQLNIAYLSPTEIACVASHLSLLLHIQKQDIPYATIFEDDVFLHTSAATLLKDTTWIQPEHGIIKIETFLEKTNIQRYSAYKVNEQHTLYKLKNMHVGAAGYIINQQSITSILHFIHRYQHRPLVPIDHVLFEDYIFKGGTVWQISPALCIQEQVLKPIDEVKLDSFIQTERMLRFQKKQKVSVPAAQKIIRELLRPFRQLNFLFKKFFHTIIYFE